MTNKFKNIEYFCNISITYFAGISRVQILYQFFNITNQKEKKVLEKLDN